MNRTLRNLQRRLRHFLNASARRRSKAAKLGWQKRRLKAVIPQDPASFDLPTP